MPSHPVPNLEEIAARILKLSDTWKQPDSLIAKPYLRHHAISGLLKPSVEADALEGLVADIIGQLDKFDRKLKDDPCCTTRDRLKYLVDVLRQRMIS